MLHEATNTDGVCVRGLRMNLCDELLHGAIDRYQHSALSLFERITDDLGLATEARLRGMRGVLMRSRSWFGKPKTPGSGRSWSPTLT